ncbi:MAG: TIR domain-containing protein [candidate division KSB1 bacterium]|nr:TIR domain-containing protein [candidate division KSB1 bacterium]MDZ7407124.1 TIR domain-containing protein [candidate division KSB1 bacterium]
MPPEPTSPKVFVSYAWKNQPLAKQLQKDLRRDGVEVFIDYEKITGGDSLPDRISAGLDWCNTLVLLWSVEAAQSYYVSQEWESAFHLKKKIIPCMLDDTPLPALLRGKLYLDFSSYESGYAALRRALQESRQKHPGEARAPKESFLNKIKRRRRAVDEAILIPTGEPSPEPSASAWWQRSKVANITLGLIILAAIVFGVRYWQGLQSETTPDEFSVVRVKAYFPARLYLDGDSLDEIKGGEQKEYKLKAGHHQIGVKGPNAEATQTINLAKAETLAVSFPWRFRSQADLRLSDDSVRVMLKKIGFYCAPAFNIKNWSHPQGKGIVNAFIMSHGDTVAVDLATSLMWQQAGSPKPMSHTEAKRYVATLNDEAFVGYKDWRLPTLEEAMSLMKPTKSIGNLHIDQKFDRNQAGLWTADRSGSYSAWVVDFSRGNCYRDRVDREMFVRVVRSVQ